MKTEEQKRNSPKGQKINPKQIRKIKAMQSRLKMSREDYEIILSEEFVNSCTALTEEEADRVISVLEGKAIAAGVWEKRNPPLHPSQEGNYQAKYEDLDGRDGFASAKQLRLIEVMWRQVSYHKFNLRAQEDALRVFINRIAKVQELRFLTKRGAHEVIEALKKMKAKKNPPRSPLVKGDGKTSTSPDKGRPGGVGGEHGK